MTYKLIFSLAEDSPDKTTDVPAIDFKRCYNYLQKRHECKACRDACPKEAIVYDKRMKINRNLCSRCHLCAGICPTQCILPRSPFVKGNDIAGNETLMISCRRRGAGFAGINMPCIASLPWEFYAYSSYHGPISIMTQSCGDCGLQAEKYIQAIFERLQLFWGEEYAGKVLKHTEAPQIQYSRREVLGLFMRNAKKPVDVLMPEETGEEAEEHPGRYRKFLLNEIDENKIHGWLTWEIGPSCWGCKVCEKLCPCRAMQLVEKDGQRMLSHNVVRCIGCQLCKLTCPEKCIGNLVEHRTSKAEPVVLSPVQAKKF